MKGNQEGMGNETQLLRVLKGFSRMKAKSSSQGSLCHRLGETYRLKKSRGVLGNAGTILKEFYDSFCEFGKN